jgi:hypothetical protein
VIALALGAKLFRIQSELKSVFVYNFTLTAKDKDTGSILHGVTVEGSESSSSDLFQQSVSYQVEPTGLRITGIACKPVKFLFSLEDYSTKEIWIDHWISSDLMVELQHQNSP